MPTITGNGGLHINMADLFTNSNFLQSVGVSGSGSAFTTEFLSERWVFTGSFNNFSGVIPLGGTISTFRFYSNNVLAFTATDLGLPMQVLFGFMSQADLVGLHEWIFFYDDIINGGTAGDSLLGYGGNDVINGGDGDDAINPGPGVDQVDGGAGLDLLTFNRSTSSASFTFDTAQMGSNTGQTLADGSIIRNMERFDLTTGSGNDTFRVMSIPDINGAWPMRVNGGAGYDTLIADLSSIVTTNFYLQWSNIESLQVTFGSGDDQITGGTGDDIINGGSGNDSINGNGGVDILDGGDGTDGTGIILLDLTTDYHANLAGFNTASGATMANGTIIRNMESVALATGSGNDTLTIGAFFGSVHFIAAGGIDTFIGDFSSVTAFDVDFETAQGYVDIDTGRVWFNEVDRYIITGGSMGDELLITGTYYNADDTLNGGGGNDIIDGGLGNDILNGGSGSDIIYASSGADIIDGGTHTDTLIMTSAPSVAVTISLNGYEGARTSTGMTMWTGAHVRNMEILQFNLSNLDDTVIVQAGVVGPFNINGNGGYDTLVADFTAETRTIEQSVSGVTIDGTTMLYMQSIYRVQFTSGSGNDYLNGWVADDTLAGGDGNDSIIGGLGSDLLIGGDGNDSLFAFEQFANEGNPFASGEDVLIGGAGADHLWGTAVFATASYETSPEAVLVNLWTFTAQGGHAQGDTLNSIEGLTGSAFNDTLTGNSLNNVLTGGAGDDVLEGGVGDDILAGGGGFDMASYEFETVGVIVSLLAQGASQNTGAGFDTLTGIEDLAGSGFNDTLTGDGGDNFLFGMAGSDTLSGLGGADILSGEAGDDFLFADSADTLVSGGSGTDWVYFLDNGNANLDAGANGIEVVLAGGGSDTINAATQTAIFYTYAGGGNDTVTGGSNNDHLYGQDGNDVIVGGGGADLIWGEAGADSLSGGDGDDTLIVDVADTLVSGGAGYDYVYLTGAGNFVIDAGAAGLEWLFAAGGDDAINAASQSAGVVVYGAGGSDVITGGAGADILFGQTGNDTIVGGAQNDTLWGEAGADSLSGGDGDDTLIVDVADTLISGGAGTDYIYLTGAGNFVIDAAAAGIEWILSLDGNDALNAASASASFVAYAGGGDDAVTGGNGDDSLFGQDGNDVLVGGAGGDVLLGEAGTDTITGGAGGDVIIGGLGADTFVYQAGWGADSVLDFQNGSDLFDMTALAANGVNDIADLVIGTSGADATITWNGNLIIVAGAAGQIDSADFIFGP